MQILTGESLRKICPSLTLERSNVLASIIEKVLPAYDMYSKAVLPEFLAQVAHESNEFADKAENLNYSAEAIKKTWPTRFNTILEATLFERNPQRLANKVYNGRMGNAMGSNDGWNFRGSGFMQLTGKDSIIAYLKFKQAGKGFKLAEKVTRPEEVVELLRTNDVWAMDAACWFFAVSKGLIDEAQKDQFEKITKAVNGGLIGIESRMKYYDRCRRLIN